MSSAIPAIAVALPPIQFLPLGFAKNASKTYAGDGGIMEWTFHAGTISALLGA